jgi:hypothetical protein
MSKINKIYVTSSVNTNKCYNLSDSAGINITDTSIGNLNLSGSVYQTKNNHYLSLDANSNVTTTQGLSSKNYTDFRIKQSNGVETNISVYAQKFNEFVTLHIPAFSLASVNGDTSFFSYVCNEAALLPIDSGHQNINVSNEQGFVRFIQNKYMEFKRYTGKWLLSNDFKSFTISYRSTNNTQLSGSVFGTTYPIIGLASWATHPTAPTAAYKAVHVSTDNKFQVALSGSNFIVSTNSGVNWTTHALAASTYNGCCTSSDGAIMYICNSITANTIQKSTNQGGAFSDVFTGIECTSIACSSNGQIVIAGTLGQGIRRSIDGGTTWTSHITVNVNFHDVCINDEGNKSYGVGFSGAAPTTGQIAYWTGTDYAVSNSVLRNRLSISCNRGDGNSVIAYGGTAVEFSKTGYLPNSWGLSFIPSETFTDSTTNTLGSVHMVSTSNGKVYKSTNGGESFNIKTITATSIDAISIDGCGCDAIAGGNALFKYGLDSINPAVITLTPSDNGSTLLATNLTVQFNETILKSTGTVKIFKASDNSLFENCNFTVSGDTATITHNNFVANNNYYVQIDANAITDISNNTYGGFVDTTTWNFTAVNATVITTSLNWSSNNLSLYEDTSGTGAYAGTISTVVSGTNYGGEWVMNQMSTQVYTNISINQTNPRIKSYIIAGSQDSSIWTMLYNQNNASGDTAVLAVPINQSFTNITTYNYYRLIVTSSSNGVEVSSHTYS